VIEMDECELFELDLKGNCYSVSEENSENPK
jgi:hypothetical protein